MFFFRKFRHNRHFFRHFGHKVFIVKNYLSTYGVNFTMEPLQNASYVDQCGRYEEMVVFRQFFRTLIRHISTLMTSWQKFFGMRIGHS